MRVAEDRGGVKHGALRLHPSIHNHTNTTTHTHTTNQNTTHREHPETEALLDALTDSLAQAESGPVRALCASVLAEFLDYAIRQVNKTHTHMNRKCDTTLTIPPPPLLSTRARR